MFQLHEQEVPVHGRGLKLVLIRQHQVGVELQAALAKPAEDPGHFFTGEEFHHPYLLAATSSLVNWKVSRMWRWLSGSKPRTARKTSSCRMVRSKSTIWACSWAFWRQRG